MLLFREGLSADETRRLAIALSETCGGRAAVFGGGEQEWKYALCAPGGDLRALTKDLNAALHGRGGGKPAFVQGSVCASQAEIEEFFSQALPS